MSCENCVSRREFLSAAAGATGLVVLSGCGDGVISGVSAVRLPPRGGVPSGQVKVIVASFPGLATAGVLVKVVSFYAAKRTGASSFEVFSMACTHEGCLVDITNGERFDCPCHGSRFANDGSVLLGPATRPLQSLPSTYDPATDTLTIN